MWEAIAFVSSGVTLTAFLAAVIAWVYKAKAEERERLIRTAKPEQRADLVRNALEFFHVDTTGLTREQQYNLAIEQIRARAQRFKVVAALVCFLSVVAAAVAIYAMEGDKTKPSAAALAPSLLDEGKFRLQQIDEVLAAALKLQTDCFGQLERDGSVAGSCVRDYLNQAQVVATAFELGGIYRPPGKDGDTVWIGTSGYGLRHLPSRRGFKDPAYADRDLRDLVRASTAEGSSASPKQARASASLQQIKELALFSETDVLADWFKRHQAQGIYQERYGTAYKVYEARLNDYRDQLSKVKRWLDRLNAEWQRFKGLDEMKVFR
ncbi:MAG: hypothetical protein L6Q69_23070 [Zoogloea sp.]|nr:hypothetical protein [Zoogloea sp.]